MTAPKTSQTAAPVAPDEGAAPSSLPLPPVADEWLGGNAGGHRSPAAQGDGGAPRSKDEAAAKLAAAMDEDAVEWHLRKLITDLKALGGQIVAYHPWKTHARRAEPGWPDWTIAGPGGVIFRELKRERAKPTKAQQRWLDWMTAAGLDAGVWRPSDVVSARMGAELAKVAGIGGGR